MSDKIETGTDGVKTADDLRDIMGKVAYGYLRDMREAEVQAIFEEALGFDDFTGLVRDADDLTDSERAEAFKKLEVALSGPSEDDDDDDDIQAKIRASNESRKGEANKARPTVELKSGYLPQAIARVERLLLMEAQQGAVQDRIFQRDGKLVRLSRNLLPPGTKFDDEYRENNALLISEVKPKWLANRLDRSIMFVGASAGKPVPGEEPKRVPKNAPAELCARMIEDDTRWKHPHLFGTIEAPTLRADGTVIDRPGYDKRTGLFFDPGTTEFPPIPVRPSRAAGVQAMQMIEDLLCDFPFQDAEGYEGVSKAVALAAVLTGPVRRTLDIAPAFAVTAMEAETGKTELCKMIAGITLGREVPGQQFSNSEEERRKSIGANLRSGRPILFFDNADNVTIEGDFTERMLTMTSINDRVLTTTEEYTAPTNCLVLFNGNHITIGGAMTTRVLLSRIVTDTPLSFRAFNYPDLFRHVVENRPALVAAVLTALRAWLLHGQPDPKRATSRFKQWDSLIAQALVWYGYADPARGGDELREVDPVKEAKREVVRQWSAKWGDTTVTAADLQRCAEVRKAIAEAKECTEREVTPMRVGKYVSTLVGTRLDLDWVVVRQATAQGHEARWRLKWVGDGDSPALAPAEDDAATAAADFEDA
jgi:hypothetical protein